MNINSAGAHVQRDYRRTHSCHCIHHAFIYLSLISLARFLSLLVFGISFIDITIFSPSTSAPEYHHLSLLKTHNGNLPPPTRPHRTPQRSPNLPNRNHRHGTTTRLQHRASKPYASSKSGINTAAPFPFAVFISGTNPTTRVLPLGLLPTPAFLAVPTSDLKSRPRSGGPRPKLARSVRCEKW